MNWTTPSDYTPRTKDAAIDENMRLMDEIYGIFDEPVKGEPMPMTSKLILLACAFVMGAAIGMAV